MLIGSSSAINILLGIVRTKIVAVILGPAGFGLHGLFNSIMELVVSIAGLGVSSSGVREVAAARESSDCTVVPKTVKALRRTCWILGGLGGASLMVFASYFSRLTFNSPDYQWGVALLGSAVFLRMLANGESAILQGFRRIGDLSRSSIYAGLISTFGTIVVVFYWREAGIVPAIALTAAVSAVVTRWYLRGLPLHMDVSDREDTLRRMRSLIHLGVAFMASGLVAMASAYVIRIMLTSELGLDAAGYYHAAWTIGGLYLGFVFQAMGADFYPRLTSVAQNHEEANRLVNEQAMISLLLGGPGILATIACSPFVIALFYSEKFASAVPMLRWICLGMALRVVTWPVGFMIIAKARRDLIVFTEVAWGFAHLSSAWVCIKLFGLNGAAFAFFFSYVVHGLLVYYLVRRISGFKWSSEYIIVGSVYSILVVTVFFATFFVPVLSASIIGIAACIIASLYSFRMLLKLVGVANIPSSLKRVLVLFR
ncbi:MAG TPA: O-antigen translocase [Verrucomicrobiae bacterium]